MGARCAAPGTKKASQVGWIMTQGQTKTRTCENTRTAWGLFLCNRIHILGFRKAFSAFHNVGVCRPLRWWEGWAEAAQRPPFPEMGNVCQSPPAAWNTFLVLRL